MSEKISLATPDQIEEINRLVLSLKAEDADELAKQLAESEHLGGRPVIFGSGQLQTPLLPVEDLDKFYLIHKPGNTTTVTRERSRLDISPDTVEQTWMSLRSSIAVENSTRLINPHEEHDPEDDEDDDANYLDADEFWVEAEFLGANQLDIITDELCTKLIRQLGATVVWR